MTQSTDAWSSSPKLKGQVGSFPHSVIRGPSNWFRVASVYAVLVVVDSCSKTQARRTCVLSCVPRSGPLPALPLPTGPGSQSMGRRGVPLLAHAPGPWPPGTVPSPSPGPACSSWSCPWEGDCAAGGAWAPTPKGEGAVCLKWGGGGAGLGDGVGQGAALPTASERT